MADTLTTPEVQPRDPWARAREYWGAAAKREEGIARGLDALRAYGLTLDDPPIQPGAQKEHPNLSVLLAGDRAGVEIVRDDRNPERRDFGAVPQFDQRDAIVAHMAEEVAYFARYYTPGKNPPWLAWRDQYYAEGMLLYELKFGERLSTLSETILAQYPPRGGEGKVVSLFGLSGSGKSTALDACREVFGPSTIVIDSDAVNFNLLAKKVRDVECAHGAALPEVRDHLMYNALLGSVYAVLTAVTKELRSRGYTVIRSSTMPVGDADVTVYLEHPDGIDPRTVADADVPAVAAGLYTRTQDRVPEKDNYDWVHAETILDFNAMRPVTVQVPERVHGNFLKNIRESLLNDAERKIQTIANPRIDDPDARRHALADQLRQVVG
ncbi:hypothetical protein HY629_00675 [Candidatus Uhrbacteria bacterium]|nr:hypothetical protein [Candidatus Uhrbacteria bacterium]